MGWLDSLTDSMNLSLSKLQEMGEGQRSVACCGPWGLKVSDTTERLKNSNNYTFVHLLRLPKTRGLLQGLMHSLAWMGNWLFYVAP